MSPAVLALALVLALFVSHSRADFDRDEIDNEFRLRIGRVSECGERLRFRRESLLLRAEDIRIDGDDCTGDGVLRLTENPGDNPSPAVRFLLNENDSGDFFAGRLSSRITCGSLTVPGRSEFIFLEPDDDFRVRWSTFFMTRGGGIQAVDRDNRFEFDEDTNYVIVRDDCLFSSTNIGDVCFPAAATAQLSSGRVVRMDELQTGDNVLVAPGIFSPIIGWTHRDSTPMSAIYTRLDTDSGHSLTTTDGHYVYADGKMMKAEDVRVGMVMKTGTGSDTAVVDVRRVADNGLYNPQTIHGDIVVDGLLSTTYTKTVPPMTAHAMLAPIRAAFKAVCQVIPSAISEEL